MGIGIDAHKSCEDQWTNQSITGLNKSKDIFFGDVPSVV